MAGGSVRSIEPTYRKPQQHRSKETVERILAAAEAEMGEVGLQAASTTSIAKRAGLSVGAVYRFFKDKDEIADALAAQYLEAVWPVHRRLADRVAAGADVAACVRDFIAQAEREQVDHPGFCRLADESRGADSQVAARVRADLTALVVDALKPRVKGNAAQVSLAVELCVETVHHALVSSAQDPDRRSRVVAELEVMVPQYLGSRL